jgi:hypothetical protein
MNGITCYGCKKKGHLEKDCWFKNKHKRCFNCGGSNHKKNECPKLNQFGSKNINMSNNEIGRDHGANTRNPPKPQVNAKVVVLGRN